MLLFTGAGYHGRGGSQGSARVLRGGGGDHICPF